MVIKLTDPFHVSVLYSHHLRMRLRADQIPRKAKLVVKWYISLTASGVID